MALLSTYIALLPPIMKEKYSDAVMIGFANEILEYLSAERLMPELSYQKGVIVKYKKWITPPSNYRSAGKLYYPTDYDDEYPFVESDGKLMLRSDEILEETAPNAATAFTSSAVDSITVNIDGLAADSLKDYLMVITGGTYLGNTYVISKSDASALGVTKVYYLHALSAALTVSGTPQISAANFIHPDYYLMLQYKGSFTDIAATSDEIPMSNNHEKRIMRAGLMMHGFERLYGPGSESHVKWTALFERAIMALRDEFFSGGAKLNILPRVMPGLSYLLDDDYEDKYEDDD